MQFQRIPSGYLVRLVKGEEIITALAGFIEREKIKGGGFTGLGAMADVALGYFDAHTREYVRKEYPGEYEIGNLTGNFAWLEGKPVVHAHATISGPDLAAHTGHLFKGIVSVTCEVTLVVADTTIRRALDPDVGLNLLALE
jgi:hypothetical protein